MLHFKITRTFSTFIFVFGWIAVASQLLVLLLAQINSQIQFGLANFVLLVFAFLVAQSNRISATPLELLKKQLKRDLPKDVVASLISQLKRNCDFSEPLAIIIATDLMIPEKIYEAFVASYDKKDQNFDRDIAPKLNDEVFHKYHIVRSFVWSQNKKGWELEPAELNLIKHIYSPTSEREFREGLHRLTNS